MWENRTLLMDRRVGIVRKNVDAIMFNTKERLSDAGLLGRHDLVLAAGEIKGGIDPAGADEHWKTASAALDRIRTAFADEGLSPHLFFVGAAVAAAMAREIFAMLGNGRLTHAANLNVPKQVKDLTSWLVSL